MSPNAGLVRSFPQTSIKAPRKVGPTWRGDCHRMRRVITMSVAEMCGSVLHRGRIDVESCDEPHLRHAACSASTATLATGHGAASSGWR